MKKFLIVQIVLLLLTGVIAVAAFMRPGARPVPQIILASTKESIVLSNKTKEDSSSSLLNPVVASGINKHFIIDFQPLRVSLDNIADNYRGKGYIYFSYLNNAAWVGINERSLITAASTVKVPIAMTVYKAIEDGKLTGKESYTLDEDDLNSGFGDLYAVGPDKTLSLEELMGIMLINSDNTAANALMKILDRIGLNDPLDSVYTAMGWVTYGFIGSAPVFNYGQISLKVLSNMFLSLYNATYVNAEHSQKILRYLTQSSFNDKIAAGVPSGIAVAHKIGKYESDKTYSDCGIVYAPNRNYLLCVASVGVSETKAAQFIARVSKTVYDYVMNN